VLASGGQKKTGGRLVTSSLPSFPDGSPTPGDFSGPNMHMIHLWHVCQSEMPCEAFLSAPPGAILAGKPSRQKSTSNANPFDSSTLSLPWTDDMTPAF